jgi:hypothetical protein
MQARRARRTQALDGRFRTAARRGRWQIVQLSVPAPGALVWIRQARWRVRFARRDRDAVRLDVTGSAGAAVFLSPFDRVVPAVVRPRPRRVRSARMTGRLAEWLARAGSARSLQSVSGAAIDILPFQLEPTLALVGGARRVVLADAVGLGKTIQAGLAIAELTHREPALRTLVVVPGSLRRQWTTELHAHFGLQASGIDAGSLGVMRGETRRDENPWQRSGVAIGSVDFLKQRHILVAACAAAWDLLIVDEAHGVCGDSERHAAVAALAARSRRVVLLSATPHSGDASKFRRLLDLGTLPCDTGAPLIFRRTRGTLGPDAGRRVRWRAVPLTDREAAVLEALARFEQFVLSTASTERTTALLLLSVFRKRALSTFHAFLVSVERRLAWLAGRVDRIGQRRRVHIDLLVARHEAEAGMLAHVARRTLTAGGWLGADLLPITADESAVRNHLLAGIPLPAPAAQDIVTTVSTRWRRPALTSAKHASRRRVFAAAWRGPHATGRPLIADVRRLPRLRCVAGESCLLFFSVPFVDGQGRVVETQLVALRVAMPLADVLRDRAILDAACASGVSHCRARHRRLRSLLQREAPPIAAVEHDISELLLRDTVTGELQPGLFDRRIVRAAAASQAAGELLRLTHEDRLASIGARARVEIESPVLELAIGDLSVRREASR